MKRVNNNFSGTNGGEISLTYYLKSSEMIRYQQLNIGTGSSTAIRYHYLQVVMDVVKRNNLI